MWIKQNGHWLEDARLKWWYGRNAENLPTHSSKMINLFAADQKPALGALFPPVVLFVGEKAATAREHDLIK